MEEGGTVGETANDGIPATKHEAGDRKVDGWMDGWREGEVGWRAEQRMVDGWEANKIGRERKQGPRWQWRVGHEAARGRGQGVATGSALRSFFFG